MEYIKAWPAMQATAGEPAMTLIPKTENFQEKISNVEKILKEAILNSSPKFY